MEAIAAGQRARRTPRVRPWLIASAGALAAFALALAALFAGIGILYLIRDAGAFSIGPEVRGALPLEQLAGQDAQPLFHMLIAWIPAGFCAGLALAALTKIGTRTCTFSLAALATVVLMLAGGISDSVAVNDPLSPHLVPQLTRGGTWIAIALFALGALGAGLLPRRQPSRR